MGGKEGWGGGRFDFQDQSVEKLGLESWVPSTDSLIFLEENDHQRLQIHFNFRGKFCW